MESPTPVSTYQLDSVCEINLGKNCIEICVHSGKIDRVEVRKIISKIKEIAGDKEYRILTVCHNESEISFGALKELMRSDAFEYAYAKAYIINSLHQRLMASIYSLFVIRKTPVKFFSSKNDGLQWLQNVVVY